MPNWECPRCHTANPPSETICRACHQRRPSSWEKGEWVCSRGHRNPNTDEYCSQCGELATRGSAVPKSPPADPGTLLEGIRRDRQKLIDDFRADRQRVLDEMRSVRPSGGGSAAASPASSIRGSTDAPLTEAGTPEMRVPPHAERAPAPPRADTSRPEHPAADEIPPGARTPGLEVQIRALDRVNYALLHCGLPLVRDLAIHNPASEPARDVLLKVWLATDYGEPWQKSVPVIPAGGTHLERGIVVPLRKARLQEIREAEMTHLKIEVWADGVLRYADSQRLEVLAYNEWYYHPAIPETIACFVQPNSESIENTVSLVARRLGRDSYDPSLSGYQSGNPGKVFEMLHALYLVLQKDLALTYINPPPSFEPSRQLSDGSYVVSQKVFFPERIVKQRRGTCLDLALFTAACLERVGLHPLLFLISGHAFLGVWMQQGISPAPAVRDHKEVMDRINDGTWLPLNSTTCTHVDRGFENCVNEALGCLEDPERFWVAVDVKAARDAGIKPIPPLPPSV